MAPDFADFLLIRVRHVNGSAVEHHGSRIRPLQEVNTSKEGRLSGAGGAENGDHIALVHREIHAVQDGQIIKGLMNIFDFQ